MDRRNFLALATAAGSALATGCANASSNDSNQEQEESARLERVGIQLYTVRSLMEQDFEGTLRLIADLGYDEVEFAGYFGREPEAVRDLLSELELVSPSAHTNLGLLRTNLDGVIETCRSVGHEYLVCGWLAPDLRTSLDDWRQITQDFARFGAACQEAGLTFAHHNHDFELIPVDGVRPLELVAGETDSEHVKIELDWYWASAAGLDPAELMRSMSDRVELVHVKDMGADRSIVDLGEGTLPFADLVDVAKEIGVRHFYAENDNPADPAETAASAIAYLRAL